MNKNEGHALRPDGLDMQGLINQSEKNAQKYGPKIVTYKHHWPVDQHTTPDHDSRSGKVDPMGPAHDKRMFLFYDFHIVYVEI